MKNEVDKINLEKIKVSEMKAAKYNPRKDLKPDDIEYQKLKRSIDEFGLVEPVVWNKRTGNIVGGHQRFKVLMDSGLTELNCVVVDLDDNKEKALNVALNKVTGSWDNDKLMILLTELTADDFDVSLTGFDAIEMDVLFKDSLKENIKEDNFDLSKALEEASFVQKGDLWFLGNHRLLCADSTNASDVAKLMDGKKANLVVTDPPYLISYAGKAGAIKNDNLNEEKGYEFLYSAFKQAEESMADDSSIYIFHADTKGEIFRRAFREAGFHLSMCCVWKKSTFTLSRMPYQPSHEPCLFGWKKKGKHIWYSDRKQSTVWEFDKPHKNDIHATMKPVPLIAYIIQNSTMTGCIVLDLFSGSFSTGIACEQTNRICYAMEIDEKYASASIKRYAENFGTDEISVERNGKIIKYTDLIKN